MLAADMQVNLVTMMIIIKLNDDQDERFEERISGGDTAGAGEGGGKAASRGCSAQQISSLLFLS